MKRLLRRRGTLLCSAAAVSLIFCLAPASAQSIVWDFEDGTDQGWGNSFADDASNDWPIINIGGSNRMAVQRDGSFQEAEFSGGDAAWLDVFNAAAGNPGDYVISYDYYFDTSVGDWGTFLQTGTYINGGPAFDYSQDFPDLDIGDVDLASGNIFSGTISETLSVKYGDTSAFTNSTFARFGLILNGDGADQIVYFDNISISPSAIPEPTSAGLLAMGVCGFLIRRRR